METTSQTILAKFDLADRLVAKLPAKRAAGLALELGGVRTRYALATSHIFLRAALGGDSRVAAREEFARTVAAEGFVDDLDRLVARAEKALGLKVAVEAPRTRLRRRLVAKKAPGAPGAPPRLTPLQREARGLLVQYDNQKVDCVRGVVAASLQAGRGYGVCSCGVDMGAIADTSELACPRCGQVRELIGTVFDDSQFYSQEGQKAKSGSFNPNRHFRHWMDHILAREPEEELGDRDNDNDQYGELLLKRLRGLVRRDGKILRLLTVNDVRAMLKETKRTSLNKNAALILKKLTGVGPPRIAESLYQRVEKIFSKAIEVGERLRFEKVNRRGVEARTNRNHYPYYIYKVLDSVLAEDDLENRRVLYYIYMQGEGTIRNNDEEWKEICAQIDEVTWAPTSRAKALKYRPK